MHFTNNDPHLWCIKGTCFAEDADEPCPAQAPEPAEGSKAMLERLLKTGSKGNVVFKDEKGRKVKVNLEVERKTREHNARREEQAKRREEMPRKHTRPPPKKKGKKKIRKKLRRIK